MRFVRLWRTRILKADRQLLPIGPNWGRVVGKCQQYVGVARRAKSTPTRQILAFNSSRALDASSGRFCR